MQDKNTCADPAFVYKGYSNWKDATGERGAFNVHSNSKFHKGCTEVAIDLPRTTRDVGELLSSAHAQEKAKNRVYLLKIIQSVRYLARQGLALRGDGAISFNCYNLEVLMIQLY